MTLLFSSFSKSFSFSNRYVSAPFLLRTTVPIVSFDAFSEFSNSTLPSFLSWYAFYRFPTYETFFLLGHLYIL